MTAARILVVDDEPGIQTSLCGVLRDEGYQADAVSTGEACLEELARGYELVVLDVWLPGLDGMETLARIEEIQRYERSAIGGHCREIKDRIRVL